MFLDILRTTYSNLLETIQNSFMEVLEIQHYKYFFSYPKIKMTNPVQHTKFIFNHQLGFCIRPQNISKNIRTSNMKFHRT